MLSESAGNWGAGTQATLPTDAAPPTSYNAQTTVLDTLACPDATDCTAAGSYTDLGRQHTTAAAARDRRNLGHWPGGDVAEQCRDHRHRSDLRDRRAVVSDGWELRRRRRLYGHGREQRQPAGVRDRGRVV